MKKIIKRIKGFFKKLFNRIKYFINPKYVNKKERKKIRKEKEISEQYSAWGNFLRWITGCNDLKIKTA